MTSSEALYLYAVVPDGVTWQPVHGIDDRPAEAVRGAQLAVIASEVDLRLLARVNEGADAPGLGALAQRHDVVVREAAAASSAVLPFRLGTVVSDRDAALRYLDASANQLLVALRRVDGCREWGVTVHARAPERAESRSAADASRPKSAELAGPGAGATYLARRRSELGRLEELRRAQAQARDDVALALGALAVDATAGRARRPDATLCETYLVRRDAEEAFLAEVDLCSERLVDSKLSLELSGPWPPYSFAPGFVTRADNG